MCMFMMKQKTTASLVKKFSESESGKSMAKFMQMIQK